MIIRQTGRRSRGYFAARSLELPDFLIKSVIIRQTGRRSRGYFVVRSL
ncbi:MAG: hypothetical protein F6K31_32010 [Symploca sp. SIO2G7]|nr:hypothetical protein [Symploca sp. SIO2G7]